MNIWLSVNCYVLEFLDFFCKCFMLCILQKELPVLADCSCIFHTVLFVLFPLSLCHAIQLEYKLHVLLLPCWALWIWVRSWNWGCLVTWFCYQMIAKPGNKTASASWPDPHEYECIIILTLPINCSYSSSTQGISDMFMLVLLFSPGETFGCIAGIDLHWYE